MKTILKIIGTWYSAISSMMGSIAIILLWHDQGNDLLMWVLFFGCALSGALNLNKMREL